MIEMKGLFILLYKKAYETIFSFKRGVYNMVTRIKVASCGNNLHVNHLSRFTRKTIIGNNCNFNGMKVLGNGSVVFGDYFHSGSECMIITSNHNYEGCAIPYDDTYIDKTVEIGPFVWLGNRVTITGNVKIGEGAIIAASSLVCKNVPPLAIVGGNPCKILKYRDKDHFEELKEKGKFY